MIGETVAQRPIRVLAFMKYGNLAASARQRMLQYLPRLRDAGIEVEMLALLGDEHLTGLTHGRRKDLVGIAAAYLRRTWQLVARRGHDIIWVQYELFPYLPSMFERLVRAGGTPVVYDYDDAIFHMYDRHRLAPVRRVLGGKLAAPLRRAAAVTCGSPYVRDYALRYCPRSFIFPTVVDTDAYRPRDRDRGAALMIGWIGSPSTWGYMRPLLPMLADLARTRGVRIRVVGAGHRATEDAFEGLDLVDWTEATEIADVQAMDIGIMPVPDEPWTRGKSGYKLFQYMACGLPVVASPVGINAEIVVPGETGFLATDVGEWRVALEALIGDPALRRGMGVAGRARAVERYSLATHAPRLIRLLQAVHAREPRLFAAV